MSAAREGRGSTDEVRRGLNMAHPPDPARLAAERAELTRLEGEPLAARVRYWSKLIGPGYLQSAMTLGGGTAASSLFAGALFGYALLWVAPVAMLLGVVMLSAVSWQTLSTGARPLPAMRKFAGRGFAWGWALGALLSSVVWHFPQYNLAAASLVDVGAVAGVEGLSPVAMAFVVLAWAVLLSFLYGRSARLVRVYERVLKYMVWGIVLCFLWVVVQTHTDWGGVVRGFTAFEIPGERNGIRGAELVVSGLAAAVGVNMLFLYPYSLLARGWGREHRGVARFDLFAGMLVPYALATSLMVIATANTIHADGTFAAKSLPVSTAARVLGDVIGPSGRVVFDLGLVGMALSSITLHMLTAGFVAMEWFGVPFGGRGYRLATLIPTPGVLGPLLWGNFAVWLAVPTTIVCGLMLPVAYVGFVRLQCSRRYLGDDRPRGVAGVAWVAGMVVATVVLVGFLAWYLVEKVLA